MISLTPSQADCARVIAELTELDGRPPSYEEIAAELDINKGAVARLVRCLEDRGWIEREAPHRGLRLRHAPPALPRYGLELTAAGRAYAEAA